MKEIFVPGSMSIKSLVFTAVVSESKPSFSKPTIHVFELLRFPDCRIEWNNEKEEGEFIYPSEEWLAEKLQEVLNGRS